MNNWISSLGIIVLILTLITALINFATARINYKKANPPKDVLETKSETVESDILFPKQNGIWWFIWRIYPTTITVMGGGYLVLCYFGKNVPATFHDVVLILGSAYMFTKGVKYLQWLNSIKK
jgi:hypothetical protein